MSDPATKSEKNGAVSVGVGDPKVAAEFEEALNAIFIDWANDKGPSPFRRALERAYVEGARGEKTMPILDEEGEPKPTAIIINGITHEHVAVDISYEHLVQIGGMNGTPSMTWRVRGTNEGGILTPGQRLTLREGLVVNIAHTGNA